MLLHKFLHKKWEKFQAYNYALWVAQRHTHCILRQCRCHRGTQSLALLSVLAWLWHHCCLQWWPLQIIFKAHTYTMSLWQECFGVSTMRGAKGYFHDALFPWFFFFFAFFHFICLDSWLTVFYFTWLVNQANCFV